MPGADEGARPRVGERTAGVPDNAVGVFTDPDKATVTFPRQGVYEAANYPAMFDCVAPRYRSVTTGGGAGTKAADVANLRHELAAQSLAFAEATDDPAEKFIRLWESYCYEADPAVRAKADALETTCVDALAACRGLFGADRKFRAFKRFVEMLVNTKWMTPDAKIKKALDAAKEPPKPQGLHLRDL